MEHSWAMPLAASLLFLGTMGAALFVRQYSLAFVHLCHSVSFFAVVSAIDGRDVAFWNAEVFVYRADSVVSQYLATIWAVSSAGMAFGLSAALFCVDSRCANRPIRARAVNLGLPPELNRTNTAFAFAGVVALLAIRLANSLRAVDTLPGFESILYIAVLLLWAIALSGRALWRFALAATATALFTISQIISGDRDFIVVFFALIVVYLVNSQVSFARLLAVSLAISTIVLGGTILSMTRMDVTTSGAELLDFLRFNSWNAVLLPVVLMVEAEWYSDAWLLGKTYLDVLMSLPPSPLFSLVGMEKPIVSDNPAEWFYVQGLGGMHASGVAYRNFGFVGVFVQAAAFAFGITWVQVRYQLFPTFWRGFLLLVVLAAVMHTLWYGLVYLGNSLVFFALLYFILNLLHFSLRPIWEVLVRSKALS